MARILLTVWPYAGHYYPNIALATALRRRGHEVAVYTGTTAHAAIKGEGFACFPFERVAQRIAQIVGHQDPANARDTPQLYERLTALYTPAFDKGPMARIRDLKAMFRDWLLGTVQAQVEDLQQIVARWQPDVIVTDPFMWGPSHVLHEVQSVPVAVFSYFASCLLPGDGRPAAAGVPRVAHRLAGLLRNLAFADIRRGVDALRESYRLPPLPTPVMGFAGRLPLYLVASSPEFDYKRCDLSASVQYLGPCLWDKPSAEPTPGWLQRLQVDPPIVYVTEGTANVRVPTLLRAAAEGLAGMPVQVVMTTGRHRDPRALELDTVAANMRVERWVAHSDLLPKTSLVVTHGGSGTVLSALQAGLPQVVVPMQWDHFENADRVAYSGAGIRLAHSQCTAARLRAAVEQMLDTPAFRSNAQHLAQAFIPYGGPDRAAILLETLLDRPAGSYNSG